MANTPIKIDLKRDESLKLVWDDGQSSVFPIVFLRSMCPCAECKEARGQQNKQSKLSLTVLPGNYSQPLSVLSAELVGNYALRLDWSDGHGSGIYSFEYLRSLRR